MSSNQIPPFIPLTISWNLTKRCNLACEHCYLDASSKEKGTGELTTPEALEILNQLAAVNREAVLIFTGGEPLIRRDIFTLIEEASRLGFWTVLGSHGGLLDEKTAEQLIASQLKGVGVSLDSLNPETHNRFRGIPGAWEKTVRAMEVMREKKIPFLIETTATRFNQDELENITYFAFEKGAVSLNVFFLVPTGRGANLSDLTPQEIEEALRRLAKIQEKFDGKLLVNAKCAPHYRRVFWELNPDSPFIRTFRGGGCPAGTYYCRITPEGDVTPCPYMPLSAGNLRKNSFQEIWRSSPVLQDLREPKLKGRCGACEFQEFCGGCRCRAYAVTGDYLAEDPSCAYQPGKYKDKTISLLSQNTYGIQRSSAVQWTEEAREKLKKIPFFARGMVKNRVEEKAKQENAEFITGTYLESLRKQMSGRFPLR